MSHTFARLLAAFLFGLALAGCSTTSSRDAQTPLRIALVGDSTQTEKQGYGTGFCANLLETVDCMNRAKGGTSTKTYRAEGLWTAALAAKPDWMLIQFGHNDVQSSAHSTRETDLVTEYPANLRRFIEEARAAGIHPVLVTPIARRYFQADGKIRDDLPGHVEAMKKVAAESARTISSNSARPKHTSLVRPRRMEPATQYPTRPTSTCAAPMCWAGWSQRRWRRTCRNLPPM